MNNDKNKYTWGIVVGVIVVIIIIAVAMSHKKTADVSDVTPAPTDSTTLSADSMSSEDVTTGSVHATTPSSTLSYNEALALYKDKRIQFMTTCQATPINATFKGSVDLMLDNRSAETRNLHLGSLGNVTIKPWGFKIVNFSSASLPKAIVIDCDQSQNVAEVTLQK